MGKINKKPSRIFTELLAKIKLEQQESSGFNLSFDWKGFDITLEKLLSISPAIHLKSVHENIDSAVAFINSVVARFHFEDQLSVVEEKDGIIINILKPASYARVSLLNFLVNVLAKLQVIEDSQQLQILEDINIQAFKFNDHYYVSPKKVATASMRFHPYQKPDQLVSAKPAQLDDQCFSLENNLLGILDEPSESTGLQEESQPTLMYANLDDFNLFFNNSNLGSTQMTNNDFNSICNSQFGLYQDKDHTFVTDSSTQDNLDLDALNKILFD